MTNLLPPQQIEKNISEYRLRLAGTALAMFAGILVLATILLAPSYLLATHKRAVVENDPIWQDDKDGEMSRGKQKEFEDVIKETNTILGTLGRTDTEFYVSEDIIEKVIGFKTPSITISGIFFDAVPEGSALSIKGIATNRQSLVSFTDTLKKDPAFVSVDLPISNLVKDRDISFSISIKLKGVAPQQENAGENNVTPEE